MADVMQKGEYIKSFYQELVILKRLAQLNPKEWASKLKESEQMLMNYLQEYDNPSAFIYALDKIAEVGKEQAKYEKRNKH